MNTQIKSAAAASLTLCSVLAPSLARADHVVRLERNQVVPLVLDNDISVRNGSRGERFTATVANSYDLPRGTRFHGRVLESYGRRGENRSYLDVEFTSIELPGGRRTSIQARPVSMDGSWVRRDSDGRNRSTNKVVPREQIVLGSTVAGALIARLLDKDGFKGAMVGAVAGIIIAESQGRGQDERVTLRRGSRIGALIERPVTLTVDADWRDDRDDRYYPSDRYGRDERWEREDRYDQDDRWNRDQDWNRYGNDIQIRYRNRLLRFQGDARPYFSGSTVMVPLEATASQLDLEVRQRSFREILVRDSDSDLVLEAGSANYRLNGRRGTFDRPVAERRGETYVPLNILAEMKRDRIEIDRSRGDYRLY